MSVCFALESGHLPARVVALRAFHPEKLVFCIIRSYCRNPIFGFLGVVVRAGRHVRGFQCELGSPDGSALASWRDYVIVRHGLLFSGSSTSFLPKVHERRHANA